MTFTELQTRFANLHLDTRSEWIAGGTSNKATINAGLSEVFEKFISTFSGEKLMRTEKYQLTIVDNYANLPADFRTLARNEDGQAVFFETNGAYFQLGQEIEYTIQYGNPYKIIFTKIPGYPVYIDYVKNYTALINSGDIPTLPANLHESIVDFALVDYFRQQRDWNNIGPSLQYAEGKVLERMNNIWLN